MSAYSDIDLNCSYPEPPEGESPFSKTEGISLREINTVLKYGWTSNSLFLPKDKDRAKYIANDVLRRELPLLKERLIYQYSGSDFCDRVFTSDELKSLKIDRTVREVMEEKTVVLQRKSKLKVLPPKPKTVEQSKPTLTAEQVRVNAMKERCHRIFANDWQVLDVGRLIKGTFGEYEKVGYVQQSQAYLIYPMISKHMDVVKVGLPMDMGLVRYGDDTKLFHIAKDKSDKFTITYVGDITRMNLVPSYTHITKDYYGDHPLRTEHAYQLALDIDALPYCSFD